MKQFIEKILKSKMVKPIVVIVLIVIITFSFTYWVLPSRVVNTNTNITEQDLERYVQIAIDKELNKRDKQYDGIVENVSGGVVTVRLANDVGDTIPIQNPNEVPCEVGDGVVIYARGNNLSNSIILCRKSITLDNIYVDYTNGVDSYGYDNNGIQYGSQLAPFKTLQYTMRRLPKNLNNRNIIITIVDAPSDGGSEVAFTDGFYGGNLTIKGELDNYADVNYLWLNNCSATITLQYLNAHADAGLYLFRFSNCSNVYVNYCNMTDSITGGVSAIYGSKVYVTNCVISNHSYYGLRAAYNSIICSEDNTGILNDTVFSADNASYIGILGTEPTGVTRASADVSSTIKS